MSDSPLVSRYCEVTLHVAQHWKASLCALVRSPEVQKAMTRVVDLREAGRDEADPDVMQARAGLWQVIAILERVDSPAWKKLSRYPNAITAYETLLAAGMEEWELSSLLDLLVVAPRQNPGGGEQLRKRAAALQRQVRQFQDEASRLHRPHYTVAPNQTRHLIDDLMAGAEEAVTLSAAVATALSRREMSPAARMESAVVHEVKRCTGSEHFDELSEIFSALSGRRVDPESLCRRPAITNLRPPVVQLDVLPDDVLVLGAIQVPTSELRDRPRLLFQTRETVFRQRREGAAAD